MGHAIEANEQSLKDAIEGGGLVLVDFWAPWCAPCRALTPALDAIAKEYDGKAKVVKINVDENQKFAAQFNIQSIPALLFFKGGQVKDMQVGLVSKDVLARKLDALV